MRRKPSSYTWAYTFREIGTYTGTITWTSIEPSVGVVSACLPTLRPLLRETWLRLEPFRLMSRSATGQHRQSQAIRLGSYHRSGREPKSGYHTKWLHHDLDLATNEGVSRSTAVTTMVGGGSDHERDDRLLININVQHDVQIEHAPRFTIGEVL